MASIQAQPSGTDVSNVESDIVQTISLADTIVTLIREPIALVYNNVTKVRELKRSLGLWQEEALDNNGKCRVPVLRLKEFEDYLVRMDGVIPAAPSAPSSLPAGWLNVLSWSGQRTPSPNPSPRLGLPSAGTACWAYFLFALGIRPGMGVAAWRPPTGGFIHTQDGGIEMEFDGSVLCHVINLFSVTLNPERWYRDYREELPNRRRERHCNFSFGELDWTRAGDRVHARFTPGLEFDLISAKKPFGLHGTLMDPNTIIASYFTALYHGVSDSKYYLAESNRPLPERLARLNTCLKMLNYRGLKEEEKPLLISYDWFEEAARVKRRVLAQGGKDHSFYEDICKTVDSSPDSDIFSWESNYLMSEVRKKFLLDDETFIISVPGSSLLSNPNSTEPKVTPWEVTEATLLGYEHQPAGSWKRSLFDLKDEVLAVLFSGNDVLVQSHNRIQLIEFTRRCDLWDKRIFMGAPISA